MLITDPKELQRFASCHRVWQGIPGIAHTKGGRTFLSFYSGGVKETYGNYAVVIVSEDEKNYSQPILAAEKAGSFRCFDPVLWLDPLGRLWFLWNVMPGEEVYASICQDPDAPTLSWSDEFYVGRGIMMNKPLVLSTGEWLFPIAIWKKDIYSALRTSALTEKDVAASYVYKTADNGKTFTRLGGAELPDRSFDEHMVMEMENGVLRMLVRLKKGIGESYSYDRGETWSRGQDSGLGGPSSRFFLGRLRSGRVLLINHHDFTGRNNLTAFLSEDDGKTFPYRLLLDERRGVSYPDAQECEDGSIRIVYDRLRGCFKSSLEEVYTFPREILTAKITEEDILRGTLTSPESYLKRVANALGRLAPEDADPFASLGKEDEALAKELWEKKDPVACVFERYTLNCNSVCDFDAEKLDRLIESFEKERSVEGLVSIIALVRQRPMKKTELSPVIEGVKAHILAHPREKLSLKALAKKLNISRYYLSHLFKEETGITISDYRNQLRLTRAKELLITTEESVTEIAQKLGYCSAAYFAKLFTRREKISPTKYRFYHKK